MLFVRRIVDRLQEVDVTWRPGHVFWRASIGTAQADRRSESRVRRQDLPDGKTMFPAIAKVIEVGEGFQCANSAGEGDAILKLQRCSQDAALRL